MRATILVGVLTAMLFGAARAEAAIGPAGTGTRVGAYLNDGTSLGLMLDMPVPTLLPGLPGESVLTLGLVAGDRTAGVLTIEQQFGATSGIGPYGGLGLGLMVGDDSDLGLKGSLGLNMLGGTYLQADILTMGGGGVFLGIGRRF